MPISLTENSATIGTTEYSLPNNSTTLTPQTDDCVMQAWIDFGAMAAGDEYRVRVYEKVNGTGATQRQVSNHYLSGTQSEPAFVLPSLILANGWDITVTKIAGTDRSIGWSLRKVT